MGISFRYDCPREDRRKTGRDYQLVKMLMCSAVLTWHRNDEITNMYSTAGSISHCKISFTNTNRKKSKVDFVSMYLVFVRPKKWVKR